MLRLQPSGWARPGPADLMRDLLISLFWLASGEPTVLSETTDVHCGGALSQGGLIVCTAPIGTTFEFKGRQAVSNGKSPVLFGLARDADLTVSVTVLRPGTAPYNLALDLAERSDDFRVLRGLECDKVDARTQAQKDHAGQSWVIKQEAFSSFDPAGARIDQGFIVPSVGRPSSPFGPTRKYIGVSAETGEPCERTSVHRGYDIAAAVGTPIIAPAGGTVSLADPDLYFEGGTVFLDHGGGLVSVFMHMSSVDVEVGDVVAQGDHLGLVGNTGRTTGPHLHWAVKWRDTASEDRGGDFYIDPALLMDVDLLP